MRRKLEKSVAIWSASIAVITVLLAAGSLLTADRFVAISGKVARNHEVIGRIRELKTFVRDAESGQRGFLLTGGREEYLKPFEAAKGVCDDRLGGLSALASAADADQRARLDELGRLIFAKFAELDETIRLFRGGDEQASMALVLTDHGRRLMRRIEDVVAEAERHERTELEASARHALLLRNGMFVATGLSVLFTLAILASVYRVVRREMAVRRHAEEEAGRARQAAETAARAKGEFLANMSHEIRTPMNGILGMTELTLMTELSSRQREYLDLVKSSAEALLTVIDDILDFSKIEAGKLSLDPVPFDLRDEMTDTLRPLALRAHAKGLELACRIAPDVPGSMVGDPGRIRQILINLVGNALKFTERGEICVTVEAGEPGESGREILISVRDTGIGIPTAKRESIFAPFEQADGSTTRRYGGTGLGLTISGRLAALMGGRIWVEDNPGGGSIFRFTALLGRDAAPQPRPGPAEGQAARIEGRRILIVDDNRTNRLILEELLGHWGARAGAVDGGLAALDALRTAVSDGDPFEVVLLDMMMPEMDGLTLAGRIRGDRAIDDVRMLMLTSGGDDEAGRSQHLRIGGWLAKPVRHSEFFDALIGLLDPNDGRSAGKNTPRLGRLASVHQLRVLLAEDHPINQKVAVRLLEEMGHEVHVVGNGRAAVEAALSDEFDVILMDVQMPEMDGLEATAAIRAAGRRIPIVALTAHAMAGDRDRCLSAGCDDYLSKPVSAAKLAEALDRLKGGGAGRPQAPSPAWAGRDFDSDAAMESVGGDRDLLIELLGLFAEDTARLMGEIRSAAARGDFAALKRLAHTVAGVASNFAASRVEMAARRLQASASLGDLSGVSEARDELGQALDRFERAVDEAYGVDAGRAGG